MKRDPTDMRTYPVRKQPCKTCPFSGENPLLLPPERLTACYQNLMGNGQHICHSTNNTKICRGGRNIQLKWLYLFGMLDEPTDQAFDEAVNQAFS